MCVVPTVVVSFNDGECRFNDRGMSEFMRGAPGDAFYSFTEAIRLHPKSPVFHANRAAAALKLNRPQQALDDCKNAVRMDAGYVKAYVRAGKACLQLEDPKQALEYYEEALKLRPEDIKVQKEIEKCHMCLERQKVKELNDQEMANLASRDPLPWDQCDEKVIVEQLLSAEATLDRNPRIESAQYSRVECLILCSRYCDAEYYIKKLRKGNEKKYLHAELLWRSGDIPAAMQLLQGMNNPKCSILYAKLETLQQSWARIETAIDEELYLDAIEAITSFLQGISCTCAQGLYCTLLKLRAEALCKRSEWDNAKDDLETIISIQGENLDALRCKADVCKQMKRYTEYFLTVQKMKTTCPKLPGISELIEDAARLCIDSNDERGGSPMEIKASGPQSAFQALDLSPNATLAEVRKAYLKLAAKWHPDKWVSGTPVARSEAEDKFKAIQDAYETLVTIT